MDRYFYSVEVDENDKKYIHMSGNIYYNDGSSNETDCFRIAEWTFLYIPLEELAELLNDIDVFWEYLNEKVAYLGNLTEDEAVDMCQVYFNGEPGKWLNIKHVNEDTPCGDYWFE